MLYPTRLSHLGFTLTQETTDYKLYTKEKNLLTLKIKPYYKDRTQTYGMLIQDEFGIYNGMITIDLLASIMKLNNY